MIDINRRQFFLTAAAATAATAVSSQVARANQQTAWDPDICVFTKPFNSLSFDELADQIAKAGFQGIEAPIRSGGHIEPQRAVDELSKLVEALAARDLEVTLMASDINDASDPLTEPVLRTAARLGIKRYRMKYFKYDLKKPIMPQLNGWRPQLQELAALNRQLGVTGLYQNHAGTNYFGSSLWDAQQVLSGIDPNDIGIAYDIRHATVEGGKSWPTAFHMIRPHISMVYVKDFVWGKPTDKKEKHVPLGEGYVKGPQFLKMLRKSKYRGPISLHEEYLDHRKPELVPDHLQAMKRDLGVLKGWLAETA